MGMPIYADYAFDALKSPAVLFTFELVIAFGLANLAVISLKKLNLYNSVGRTTIWGITVMVVLGLLAHAMNGR